MSLFQGVKPVKKIGIACYVLAFAIVVSFSLAGWGLRQHKLSTIRHQQTISAPFSGGGFFVTIFMQQTGVPCVHKSMRAIFYERIEVISATAMALAAVLAYSLWAASVLHPKQTAVSQITSAPIATTQ